MFQCWSSIRWWRGVDENQTRATQLYVKACDGEIDLGCLNAGIQYAQGLGVEIDPVISKTLIAKACALGNKKACGLE